MVNYHLLEFGVNPPPIPVTGRFLAHNQLSLVKKAFGADLVNGKRPLEAPTVLQAATLVRCSPTYVHYALRQEAKRFEIEAGFLPLVPPKSQSLNGYAPPVIASAAIADTQVIDFVRSVGVSRVLEAACAVEAAQ